MQCYLLTFSPLYLNNIKVFALPQSWSNQIWFGIALSETLFFFVAGKAYSRDSIMSWYPDNLILRCEEFARHFAALGLALHYTGRGP